MKLLKLRMCAFGPYPDLIEIDFSELEGLYLITGDTGAGKTTVFDAISFALYGVASGYLRSNSKSLRSDFADDKTRTFVELEFLNRGEKYTIKRFCRYDRINKNGKTKTEPEEAELTKPDGEIVSELSEVNNEIKNILGMSQDRFSKIIMIAQGEFQKFLNANTKERKEIFRKIFSTEFYAQFQYKIQELRDAEEKKLLDTQKLILENISLVSTSNEPLKTKILQTENVHLSEEFLEYLKTEIEDDKSKLEDLAKVVETAEQDKNTLVSKIQKAINDNQDINSFEKIEKELPFALKQAHESQKAYETEKANSAQRDAISKSIADLKQDFEKYKRLSELQTNLDLIKNNLEEEKTLLQTEETELAQNLLENDENKKILESLANIEVEKAKTEANIADNLKKQENFQKLSDILSQYNEKNEQLGNQQEIVKISMDNFINQEKFALKLYNTFISNQAGIIAKELKDGEPCPVCGSTNHPTPATLSTDMAVTQEECDIADKEKQRLKKICDDNTKKYTELNTTVTNLKQRLADETNFDFETGSVVELEAQIKKSLDETDLNKKIFASALKDLETKTKKKVQLQEGIKAFENVQKDKEKEISDIKAKISDIEKNALTLDTQIKEILKTLSYQNETEAKKALSQYEKRQQELALKLQNLENVKNENAKTLNNLQGQHKFLQEKVQGKKLTDIESLVQERENISKKLEQTQKEKTYVYSRCDTNEKLLESLKTKTAELKKYDARFQVLDSLFRTTSGKLSGKTKVSFENYVLATYFKQIIFAANKRLRDMTHGQFEFRLNLSGCGNKETGLDLDVFDAYTTKVRSVSTLSGGESFKAALSLALGLSDIVQQQSGGISIDTMFIDEGFGSLDTDSLDQTMQVLAELSSNNIQVGIISHVEKLRETIENKIVVTKTQNGSSLKVITP